jgi:hypothetical protein
MQLFGPDAQAMVEVDVAYDQVGALFNTSLLKSRDNLDRLLRVASGAYGGLRNTQVLEKKGPLCFGRYELAEA